MSLRQHNPAVSVFPHKVDDAGAGRSDPTCLEKDEKNADVSNEERVGKGSREKHVLTQKSPVDGPSEKELSAKVKRATKILPALALDEEGECRRKLNNLTLANRFAYYAHRAEPVAVAEDFQ